MKTETRKLVPLTLAELELIYAVLNHSLSHPCHKCLELESATNLINLHRLEMCVRKEPVKTIPSRKKTDFVMPEEPLTLDDSKLDNADERELQARFKAKNSTTDKVGEHIRESVKLSLELQGENFNYLSKEERRSLLQKKLDQMPMSNENPAQVSGSGVLSEGIQQMEKVGERTKRKYNKSKLSNLKPPFGFA